MQGVGIGASKPDVNVSGTVFTRVFWLYGLYTLLSNATFLFGYFILPEGFMRGSPQVAVGRAAHTGEFWSEFGLTLLFNIAGVVTLCVVLNFNQVKRIPMGYIMPVSLGVVTGLISGTNSFAASDLSRYSAREGMALGISIGGLEMLGYILVIAATVRYGVYQYRSWWRWNGEWKPMKVMNLREVRLTRPEWYCLALGLLLILTGAYRETLFALRGH